MKITPKLPPEGINVSKRNHLKDFFVLLAGFVSLIFVGIAILAAFADFIVGYIPVEVERDLFHEMHRFAPRAADKNSDRGRVEQYLAKVVNGLNDGWPTVSNKLHGSRSKKQRFTVAVVHMEKPNAFILPGGHIGVSHGLLRTVTTENGLAMVLAHELSHQYKRHPIRSLGRGVIVLLVLAVFTSTEDSGLVSSLSASAAQIGLLKFSRDQEREADKLGLALLYEKYGHSKGAAEFFEAVTKLSQSKLGTPVFLRSHPATTDRVKMLKSNLNYTGQKLVPLPDFVVKYAKQQFVE